MRVLFQFVLICKQLVNSGFFEPTTKENEVILINDDEA